MLLQMSMQVRVIMYWTNLFISSCRLAEILAFESHYPYHFVFPPIRLTVLLTLGILATGSESGFVFQPSGLIKHHGCFSPQNISRSGGKS